MSLIQSKLIHNEVNEMINMRMCANIYCKKVEDHDNELFVCGNCNTISYCGVECQKANMDYHGQMCRKLKIANNISVKFNLVEKLLKQAAAGKFKRRSKITSLSESSDEQFDAHKFKESSRISSHSVSSDEKESNLSDIVEGSSSYGLTQSESLRSFWSLNESSITDASSPDINCLIRFESMSNVPSESKSIDVMKIKVWHDMEVSSLGIFMPISNDDTSCKFKFQCYDSKMSIIFEKEDSFDDLYVRSGASHVGEMNFPNPIRFIALKSYFLVLKSNVACWSGEFGQCLHCLPTNEGGVQVSFEAPKGDELEEFLTEYENGSSTVKGQFPVICMNSAD